MPIACLFDSSAVILYFNDALTASAFAILKDAIENDSGALIAATAKLRGLPVVTANARDFERVTHLQVIAF